VLVELREVRYYTILYKYNDRPLKDYNENRADINFRELKGRPLTLEYHDRIEIQRLL